MGAPGVVLHVFGEDVRVGVNAEFSYLTEAQQREVLALCRETLALALGDSTQGAAWVDTHGHG